MTFFSMLSFWNVIGVLFFLGFGIVAVAAFFTKPPPARREKVRDRE